MRTDFQYLQPATTINATTAVTYHPYFTNSPAVHNCYYNHYDPVKGYLFSYHPRAYISCFSKGKDPLFYFTLPEGNKFQILCRY